MNLAQGESRSKIGGAHVVLGAIALMALVFLARFVMDTFGPQPVPVDLPTLEREFDEDAAQAMDRYHAAPLLVSATVASVHSDRVTLDTIFALNVQAYLRDDPSNYRVGDQVKLHCRGVDVQDYLVGTKPKLLDCARS